MLFILQCISSLTSPSLLGIYTPTVTPRSRVSKQNAYFHIGPYVKEKSCPETKNSSHNWPFCLHLRSTTVTGVTNANQQDQGKGIISDSASKCQLHAYVFMQCIEKQIQQGGWGRCDQYLEGPLHASCCLHIYAQLQTSTVMWSIMHVPFEMQKLWSLQMCRRSLLMIGSLV